MTSRMEAGVRIKRLPQELVTLIAAGEVVERPLSVVKELVENSLDAQASCVEVQVEEGGIELIRVSDDGMGMSYEELPLAVSAHSTSKISSAEDLLRVVSFGFRGEALHSIGSVSEMEIFSSDGRSGGRIKVVFGEIEDRSLYAGRRGTTVSVRHLFANVPARRKFLRGPRGELLQVKEFLQDMCLAFPERTFVLREGNRAILSHLGGGLESAVFSLWQGEKVELDISSAELGELRADLLIVRGASSRRRIRLFVNRRRVEDKLLRAVFSWYKDRLGDAVFALMLSLPPDFVDVNVHPSKAEVRFRNPHLVAKLAERCLSKALPSGLKVAAPGVSVSRKVELDAEKAEGFGGLLELGLEEAKGEGALPQVVDGVKARFLGRIGEGFWAFEVEEGLLILDVHASYERIVYDEISRGLEGGSPESEGILGALYPIEEGLVEEVLRFRSELESLGFALEERQGMWELKAVPTWGRELSLDPMSALRLALKELEESSAMELTELPSDLRRTRMAHSLASRACRASPKLGESRISEAEALRLLERLYPSEDAPTCPHGRPVYSLISWVEVRRRLGRA